MRSGCRGFIKTKKLLCSMTNQEALDYWNALREALLKIPVDMRTGNWRRLSAEVKNNIEVLQAKIFYKY